MVCHAVRHVEVVEGGSTRQEIKRVRRRERTNERRVRDELIAVVVDAAGEFTVGQVVDKKHSDVVVEK